MKKALNIFEKKDPLIVFNWKDSETDAEGWTVINSLRGGAAGGGTYMKKGLMREEVVSLAKMMEIRFSILGPSIGGAKSGINFDPDDPRKKDVLKRWFKVISPLLKSYYGTGGGLNIDEKSEMIAMTEEYGIWHPQEGIFNGHFNSNEADKINRIGQLRKGGGKIIEDPLFSPNVNKQYRLTDMISGYGAAEAVKQYYNIYGGNLKEKKAVIYGMGKAGSAAAFYLANYGAKIIGIIDSNGGVINEDGFTLEEIKTLLFTEDREIEGIQELDIINKKIWSIGAEIFVPCTTSVIINQDFVNGLIINGLELISCGENFPFEDSNAFFGPFTEEIDSKVSLIPDFISNCSTTRVFTYFMEDKVQLNDEAIFKDISNTIKKALKKIYDLNPSRINLNRTAFGIAMKYFDTSEKK